MDDASKNRHDVYEQIGSAIAHHRLKAGLSQAALADAIGLTRTSVSNIEKGRQKMLVHTILDIAAALSIPVAALLQTAQRPTELDVRISGPNALSVAERAKIRALLDTMPSSPSKRARKAK